MIPDSTIGTSKNRICQVYRIRHFFSALVQGVRMGQVHFKCCASFLGYECMGNGCEKLRNTIT